MAASTLAAFATGLVEFSALLMSIFPNLKKYLNCNSRIFSYHLPKLVKSLDFSLIYGKKSSYHNNHRNRPISPILPNGKKKSGNYS
jgi:hypothetical protein